MQRAPKTSLVMQAGIDPEFPPVKTSAALAVPMRTSVTKTPTANTLPKKDVTPSPSPLTPNIDPCQSAILNGMPQDYGKSSCASSPLADGNVLAPSIMAGIRHATLLRVVSREGPLIISVTKLQQRYNLRGGWGASNNVVRLLSKQPS